MVVGRVLSHRPSQLGHLDLSLVVSLEASEHDLPLAWLETVHHVRDRPFVVHVGEENELFVDEIRVAHGAGGFSVEERLVEAIPPSLSSVLEPVGKPLFTSFNTLLAEGLDNK